MRRNMKYAGCVSSTLCTPRFLDSCSGKACQTVMENQHFRAALLRLGVRVRVDTLKARKGASTGRAAAFQLQAFCHHMSPSFLFCRQTSCVYSSSPAVFQLVCASTLPFSLRLLPTVAGLDSLGAAASTVPLPGACGGPRLPTEGNPLDCGLALATRGGPAICCRTGSLVLSLQ